MSADVQVPGGSDEREVLWRPAADARGTTRIGDYLRWLERTRGLTFPDYDALWQWSVGDLEDFWASIWEYFDVRAHTPYTAVLGERSMPGATWFPGATLNYAEHALRLDGVAADNVVVVARSQTRAPVELTAAQLRDQVARARAGLIRLGVGRGDRVAAYLPNIPETVVLLFAAASLGAVFSSCAPEFGTRSVVDRWEQIEPTVLVTVDGYRYGAKDIDRTTEVAEIRAALPSVAHTVVLPYLTERPAIPDAVAWRDLLGEPGELSFDPVPFDHPLYVLYSSGTTGLPKPIVHGHGGILIEHLKKLAFHDDLGPGSRFFWFTTTGWMMWNYLVSGLLVGATILLYDGDPGYPDLGELWRFAEETETTFFGTSAPYLLACRKEGVEPSAVADVSRLRGIGSTGAPLPVEGFRWVYEHVADPSAERGLLLNSTSGGTDVCTAFVGSVPLLPVREGEIPCRCLGARIEAYDEEGRPVVGREGELVLTAPMPSMPVEFWGDHDGSRYRAAYFDTYEGVWRHGDWITIDSRGRCVISGRSDATLNRGGVRLGTAEFYAVVESLPEIADSLVVHLESDEGAGRLVLFVALRDDAHLDDELRGRIAGELRRSLSPRHVPDEVHPVTDVPRTLSGKKVEVPVKRILTGTPVDSAVAKGALANPESLAQYERYRRPAASDEG